MNKVDQMLLKWVLLFGTEPLYVGIGEPYWKLVREHNAMMLTLHYRGDSKPYYISYSFESGYNIYSLTNHALERLKVIGEQE